MARRDPDACDRAATAGARSDCCSQSCHASWLLASAARFSDWLEAPTSAAGAEAASRRTPGRAFFPCRMSRTARAPATPNAPRKPSAGSTAPPCRPVSWFEVPGAGRGVGGASTRAVVRGGTYTAGEAACGRKREARLKGAPFLGGVTPGEPARRIHRYALRKVAEAREASGKQTEPGPVGVHGGALALRWVDQAGVPCRFKSRGMGECTTKHCGPHPGRCWSRCALRDDDGLSHKDVAEVHARVERLQQRGWRAHQAGQEDAQRVQRWRRARDRVT